MLHEGPSGRVGLYLFDFSTREPIEQIYEHPEHDIDAVLFRDGRPVGPFHRRARPRALLDPEYAATYARLERSLAEEQIWVISRAEDDSRMLVWAGGEADPGRSTITTWSASAWTACRTARNRHRSAAARRPIAYTARMAPIKAILPCPGTEGSGRPLIIQPHGPLWHSRRWTTMTKCNCSSIEGMPCSSQTTEFGRVRAGFLRPWCGRSGARG